MGTSQAITLVRDTLACYGPGVCANGGKVGGLRGVVWETSAAGPAGTERATRRDMNRKLFGAIVVTGAALGACRSGLLEHGPADLSRATDLAVADMARPVDLAGDLKPCCVFGPNDPADLSGCIPIECILI